MSGNNVTGTLNGYFDHLIIIGSPFGFPIADHIIPGHCATKRAGNGILSGRQC